MDMNRAPVILAILLAGSIFPTAAFSRGAVYCVPGVKINFDPLRTLNDGKELAYLSVATKPFIVPEDPSSGILAKFSFSPDGRTFTGKLNPEIRWPDGTLVTPEQAAKSIKAILPWRPLGDRIRIGTSDKIELHSFAGSSNEGIKVLDRDTFQISFQSSADNLTGLIREALSKGSMHNRFWVFRTVKMKGTSKDELQIIGKHPIRIGKQSTTLKVGREEAHLYTSPRCDTADITLYPTNSQGDARKFEWIRAKSERAVIAEVSAGRTSPTYRAELASWLRSVFSEAPAFLGFTPINSFFKQGEPGYSPRINWPTDFSLTMMRRRKWKILSGIPIYLDIMRNRAKRDGIEMAFTDNSKEASSSDAHVMGTLVSNGRLIFLQDILSWNEGAHFLKGANSTMHVLERIRDQSASTVPPGTPLLQELEQAAQKEFSIIPLARRNTVAAVRRTSPLTFKFSDDGELDLISKVKD